jgi:hypothetical protein
MTQRRPIAPSREAGCEHDRRNWEMALARTAEAPEQGYIIDSPCVARGIDDLAANPPSRCVAGATAAEATGATP